MLTLKWIKQYNVKAKQLIDGRALIIIDNGKINIENCKKVGLSAYDVSFKLRTHHIYSTRKVKRAVVEQDGESIITHEEEENPKFPLITDGQLQTDILHIITRPSSASLPPSNNDNNYSGLKRKSCYRCRRSDGSQYAGRWRMA